jgi:chemotaxis protein CheX
MAWRAIMNKILLMNCSEKATQSIAPLIGESRHLSHLALGEDLTPHEYRMIIFESRGPVVNDADHVSKIRAACCFSPIPIIVINQDAGSQVIEHFLASGATEVLSLDAPPGACRQILQGYLTPNRKPIEKEMEYLQPFIDNTINVLNKTAIIDVTFREVYFSNDLRIYGDISGIIGLSGKSEGTVAITLYWPLASRIIARMMNVTESQINAEYIHDGTGELINMISGSTKKGFKGTPYHFDLSLPTVVVGSGHQLGHPEGSSIAVLIFDVNDMAFILQVCLKTKTESDRNQ